MSLNEKRNILAAYFKSHGGIPYGCLTIDSTAATVSNVSLNGTFYGVFDFEKCEFIWKE